MSTDNNLIVHFGEKFIFLLILFICYFYFFSYRRERKKRDTKINSMKTRQFTGYKTQQWLCVDLDTDPNSNRTQKKSRCPIDFFCRRKSKMLQNEAPYSLIPNCSRKNHLYELHCAMTSGDSFLSQATNAIILLIYTVKKVRVHFFRNLPV